MNINWKVRINNPVWWVQVVVAIITPIVAYFGITVSDLTSWSVLGQMLVNAIGNPYVLATIAVSVWNTVNDPTTAGLSDSTQALKYEKPKVSE